MSVGSPGQRRLGRIAARGRRHLVRAFGAVARILPGRACGAVDGPSEAVAETTIVWGWAHRRWDPVEAVVVLVDGRPAGLATLGEDRPDVGAARRGAERSGWSARVDVRGKAGAPTVLSALVVTRAGLVERLNDLPLETHPSGELGWLTRPRAAAVVPPSVIPIEGWALPPATPACVEIRVDDVPAGLARPLALPQPDLAATSALPWAPLAGFEHTVDLSELEPGDRVRIDAEVVTLDGSRTGVGSAEVQIGAPVSRPLPATVKAARARVDAAAAAHPHDPADAVRLLVVTHQLDLGGGQLYMLELLRHLLQELDVSCLVVSTTDGVLRDALADLGAFVHVCGRPPTTAPEEYESFHLELTEVVAAHECNVAFVNTMTAAFGADLAQRLEIPAAWAVHESYPLDEFFFAAYGDNGLHPYVRARFVEALDATAAMVFEADATRRLYESHGDARRFITVPYGIPLGEVDAYRAGCDRGELRRARGFADHETVLLCMGTYEPRKGQGALAVAFAQVAEEFPEAVLVLVGDTGIPYAKAVGEVVERLDLDNRIRLVPVVPDTYAWYAMADAFVTVSDVESLPRSVLEVMAFGVPVLAVDVFGLPELVKDGVSGLLCASRDIAAMVDGLRRILGATPAERAGLGAGASDLVRARYDSSGYAGAYRKLLRGLLRAPRAFPGNLLSV